MVTRKVLSEDGKLRLEMEQDRQEIILRPVGVIDEDAKLVPLVQQLRRAGLGNLVPTLHLDMGQMIRMNSCGIKEWLNFMVSLDEAGVDIRMVFSRCGEIFLDQMSVVPFMMGRKGKLISFYAPYYCSRCKVDVERLLTTGQIAEREGEPVPPDFTCEHCAGQLEFVGIPGDLVRLHSAGS